jgi:hypothetical protein
MPEIEVEVETIPAAKPTTPTAKISVGLEHLEPASGLPESLDVTDKRLASIVPAKWVFPTDVKTNWAELSLMEVKSNSASIDSLLTGILKTAESVYHSNLAQFTKSVDFNGIDPDTIARMRNNAESNAQKAFRAVRDSEVARLNETITSFETALEAKQTQIDGFLSIAPNPSALLEILSVQSAQDSTERARWESLLSNAGYASLLTRIGVAIMREDLQMAVACQNRLWVLKSQGHRVPMAPAEMSRRLVGKKHDELLLYQSELTALRKSTELLKREVLIGKVRGTDLIQKGLREAALKKQRAKGEGK